MLNIYDVIRSSTLYTIELIFVFLFLSEIIFTYCTTILFLVFIWKNLQTNTKMGNSTMRIDEILFWNETND